MITGIVVGAGINGTTNEYRTRKFKGTGRTGKGTGIGRGSKIGVSKVCSPERNHSNRLEMDEHNSPDHKEKRSDKSGYNNTSRQVRNPEERLNHNARKQAHNPEEINHSNHSKNREKNDLIVK